MAWSKVLVSALALLFSLAWQAAALTPEQVIKLRKAGVSNQTIQKMIETEMAVAAGGRQGRYLIKGQEGRSWVVYEASSYGAPPQTYSTGISGPARSVVRVGEILEGGRGGGKTRRGRVYTLLVSSHRRLAGAKAAAARLSALGLGAKVVTVNLPKKGRWHRVVVGRFAGPAAAKGAGESLKAEGKLPGYTVVRQ